MKRDGTNHYQNKNGKYRTETKEGCLSCQLHVAECRSEVRWEIAYSGADALTACQDQGAGVS